MTYTRDGNCKRLTYVSNFTNEVAQAPGHEHVRGPPFPGCRQVAKPARPRDNIIRISLKQAVEPHKHIALRT